MKVWPVIHLSTLELAYRNASMAAEHGAEGVFLIHMEGDDEQILPVSLHLHARLPGLKVGANYLSKGPLAALEILTLVLLPFARGSWALSLPPVGLQPGMPHPWPSSKPCATPSSNTALEPRWPWPVAPIQTTSKPSHRSCRTCWCPQEFPRRFTPLTKKSCAVSWVLSGVDAFCRP